MKRWIGTAVLTVLLAACGIDRTPPRVEYSEPAAGAQGVRLDRPFRIVFSETLDPDSFDAANVVFRVEGAVRAVEVEQGGDDRTMKVRPLEQPDRLPAQAVISLGRGIRDRAGNALAPTEIEFELADWVPLGGAISHENTRDVRGFALAVFEGAPLVVWSEKDRDDNITAYAAQWNAESHAWTLLGDYVGPTLTAQAAYPDVAVAEGVPWVIYQHSRLGGFECRAARWSGTAWETGEALNHQSDRWCYGPKLAWGGRLYAAWKEWDTNAQTEYGNWSFLQAGTWRSGSPDYASNADVLQLWDLAASPTGELWAAYEKDGAGYVAAYDGGVWALLGGGALDADGNPSTQAINAHLATDGDGRLWAAWKEGGEVRVARWDGSTWRYRSPSGADGFNPSLASLGGSLYLAWYSGQAEGVRVLRLEVPSGDWHAVGRTYRAEVYHSPRITVLPGGWPVLAWTEKTSAGDVFLRAVAYNHVP
ncbi:Ig-like domain-containing protein [Oceanithermus sp.]